MIKMINYEEVPLLGHPNSTSYCFCDGEALLLSPSLLGNVEEEEEEELKIEGDRIKLLILY